jgi:hypothetical protein
VLASRGWIAEIALDTAKCIGIGLALGIVLGVAVSSYALGIVIGLVAGALPCVVQRRRQRS